MLSNRLLRLSGIVLLLAFTLVGSAGAGGAPSLGSAGIQGSYWQIETVRGPQVGQYSSLAIDGMGALWVSYYDWGNQDLDLALKETGALWWMFTVVHSEGDVGRYTSLALDAANQPHISYYDVTGTALKYAWWDWTGWHYETVDEDGVRSSIVVHPSGNPGIAYSGPDNVSLRYAVRHMSLWEITVVDGGCVGYAPSMVQDSLGAPHIAYYDNCLAVLKYAAYVGSGGNCGGGQWNCEVVDSSPAVGWTPAIAVDSFDMLYISYYDFTNGDLKLAKYLGSGGNCGGGAWYCEVVDSVGDVGLYSDIAIDAYGAPRISYIDLTNHRAKYATPWFYGTWITQPVAPTDPGGFAGTSLALDAAGQPHITYVGPGGYLQHAYLAPYAVFLPVVRRH